MSLRKVWGVAIIGFIIAFIVHSTPFPKFFVLALIIVLIYLFRKPIEKWALRK